MGKGREVRKEKRRREGGRGREGKRGEGRNGMVASFLKS